MAWMEMDLNLKKLANFLKYSDATYSKILKKFIMVSPALL